MSTAGNSRVTGSRRPEKERQCPFCPRTFTKEEHLNRHRRSHTGEKPFHCHKCPRKYSRSDVLSRHLQTHTAESPPGPNPPRASAIPPEHQRSLDPTSGPPNASTFTTTQLAQTRNQPSHGLNSSEYHDILQVPSMETWGHNATELGNHAVQQHMPATSLLPPITGKIADDGVASEFDNHAPDMVLNVATDESSVIHTVASQSSFQQIIRSQQESAREKQGDTREQNSTQDMSGVQIEGIQLPESTRLPSMPPLPDMTGNAEEDPFGMEIDLSAFGYLSPSMINMDYLDDAIPRTPFSMPVIQERGSEQVQTLLSPERLQQIQRMWRGKRSAPGVRLIRSLWNQVIQYEADNIFSEPTKDAGCMETAVKNVQPLRWGMDDDRRKELVMFCTELESTIHRESLADITPHSTPPGSFTDPLFESSPPPGFASDGFPTKEALDAAVDFFFRYFPMPFVHKTTFNAKTTPASLLFPICLIGLAALYPEPAKPFVLRYQKKMMRFSRSELTSIALGHCSPGKFLSSIASTFLVVYLGLGLWEDETEESQSHMLSVQMLHITEKHGLFAASLGDDISIQMQTSSSSDESLWKTWARVESIKRMVVYLLWVDAAYSRLMGSSGVVNIDKVELHLPCNASLFEATSFPRFLQRAKQGAQLVQPLIKFRNIKETAPDTMDSMAMQTVLSALYLRIAAARHESHGANILNQHGQPCSPAEILLMDPASQGIVSSVTLLPRKYPTLFQSKDTITSLAWNNLCLALTVDLDLLEVAFGRDGVAAAHASVVAVERWAKSASARRAILHASQVFNILSSSRLDGSTFARPDLLLFLSALVLGMYVFVTVPGEQDHNTNVFELLQDIDWVAIDDQGMRHTRADHDTLESRTERAQQPESAVDDAARDFVRHGGPISFSKEDQVGGAPAARKILLSYMHLLDDLGKWRGSRYSRLLRTMSDFVTADGS